MAMTDAEKVARKQAHENALLKKDFSRHESIDSMYMGLSAAEISLLRTGNPSFRNRLAELDNVAPPQTQTLSASPEELIERGNQAREAQNDRALPEDRTPIQVAPQQTEELFAGVHKVGDRQYELTVDPGDGSHPEVFHGTTQSECFQKLRESKASATRELRRRRKQVQITDEMKRLQVEKVYFPPLLKKLDLTPQEIFDLSEAERDPSDPKAMLDAKNKLRLAGMTQGEIDLQNEQINNARTQHAYSTATTWVKATSFYPGPNNENVAALQGLMAQLDWAVTPANLSKAYEILKEQDILVARPASTPAPAVPAPTVAAQPAPVAQSAPAAPKRILRPASSGTSMSNAVTRRIETPIAQPKKLTLTAAEYHATPSSVMQARYKRDPVYRQAVDDLIASGAV